MTTERIAPGPEGFPTQAIPRRAHDGPQPLSFPQERLFLLDRIMPGLAAYNVPTLVRVGATLDDGLLKAALDAIVARHEILRTTIRLIDGVPAQEVSAHGEVELAVSDLRSVQPQEREAEADAQLGAFAARPFDLSSDVLLRAALVHLAPDEDLLLIVLHHVGSDHVSSGILFRELDELYSRDVRRERAGAFGAAHPVRRLREMAARAAGRASARGAARVLDAANSPVPRSGSDLPFDRLRPSVQSYRGKLREFTVSREHAQPLRELARDSGVSMYTVLLAAFKTLLHRYTGVEDLVVGAPASGRHHEETAQLLGFFSNTLALRTDLSGDPPFVELLQRIKATTLEAQIHQELPFEKLVEVLNPQRSQSHSPVFQVLLGYDVVSLPAAGAGGHAARTAPGSRLAVVAVRSLDRPAGDARRIAARATRVRDRPLRRFDDRAPDRPLHDPVRARSAATATVGSRSSRSSQQRSGTRCSPSGTGPSAPMTAAACTSSIADQAERSPGAIAVVSGQDRLTYGELEARSNQLARELVDVGVGAGSLVGICLERSVDLLVSMLGVLKTGAAYVPIDPTYPPIVRSSCSPTRRRRSSSRRSHSSALSTRAVQR